MALELVATVFAQKFQLLPRLHAFCSDSQVEGVPHGNNSADNSGVVGVGNQVFDKRAVDFELVDGELLEVAIDE